MEVEITQRTVSHKVTKVTKKEEYYKASEMASTKLFGKDLSQYEDVDIDDLLEQLSPEELEMLAGEVDPDDSLIPPSERNSYKCEKEATGPLNRKKLIDHINDQAMNEPDRPELVPYVPGTVRGKKWVPPPPPEPQDDDEVNTNEVEVDLDEEFASVLNTATEDEIVDLAAILGFHSMMNQEQYHASLLNKERPKGVGWGGVTKATKFKPLPAEPPNDTDPEESIKKLKDDDPNCKELNFNNIVNISDEQFKRLFEALEMNTKLESLSMSNVCMSDRHIDALVNALVNNNNLRTLNLETNNLSPAGIVRIMESLLKTHTIEEIRLANQRSSVLGNKIEMQLTDIIEQNPTLLRVGIHFEFNDSRNRVSRHLQKNLDTFRVGVKVRRITRKTSEGASLSFVLPANSPPASPQPPSPIPEEEVETTTLNGEGRLMEDIQNEMAFEEDEDFGDKEE
ncbi:tropomodulin-1-like isoform X1 [Penaeus monodon]|uniref:tropomodulin-1-like isoform X1 n=1 Tax=Penaeus monodon TaxID=6687 RepID=UPI0018A74292|nr:tropomodulin-1-like isoform X1 [Penaeus monodon]